MKRTELLLECTGLKLKGNVNKNKSLMYVGRDWLSTNVEQRNA